mmetsp:Transcript_32775/g.76485  ORF Transcript_32775/g.76485 Transcript_32775/m.76485 type:complete len:126 (+) Transcript_32775:451-828(+)
MLSALRSNRSCVPVSATRPWSITAMVCALTTVERRCATSTTVCAPLQMRWSSAFCTCASLSASSADVASSRSKSLGFRSSARATAIRCFCPPERRWPRSPTRVPYSSSKLVMKSCACAALAAAMS